RRAGGDGGAGERPPLAEGLTASTGKACPGQIIDDAKAEEEEEPEETGPGEDPFDRRRMPQAHEDGKNDRCLDRGDAEIRERVQAAERQVSASRAGAEQEQQREPSYDV